MVKNKFNFRVSQLIKIGKLSRVHGLQGDLLLSGDRLNGLKFKKNGFVYLEINQVPTPFFIVSFKQAGKNLALHFEGINSIEAAQKLIGKEVLAEKEQITHTENNTETLAGYKLIDEQQGVLGNITELIRMAKQSFISILINDEESLLPYHPDFIIKIDHPNKVIYYKAPEGLFDILKA